MERYRTPFGDTMSWITGGADTSGAYSLHERIAPAGARSTPHRHGRLTEVFYVLGGAFEFEIDGDRLEGIPGLFVQALPGVTHSWRVIGDTEAKAIVMFRPSAERAYFEELDAMVGAGPIGPAALRDLADRYGWT